MKVKRELILAAALLSGVVRAALPAPADSRRIMSTTDHARP